MYLCICICIFEFVFKWFIHYISNKEFGVTCGVLRDLVPFVQFKKREKHPWRSVTFSRVAG